MPAHATRQSPATMQQAARAAPPGRGVSRRAPGGGRPRGPLVVVESADPPPAPIVAAGTPAPPVPVAEALVAVAPVLVGPVVPVEALVLVVPVPVVVPPVVV